ncbi:PD-(D/E)XK nuclease family protein [Salinispira pacifica]|uniref:PD-(D/E)XK endonuclease-like domain-containing protein n=1 Tax=Salinispira pacifica TaxID=1307761 RepID=V5WCR9_9SPIO|nr:PD-(D/E)XK nuclease family protein [Salinispira pacifica]AHC13593.1 hypothetical protein L21SP2_0149 [Salinispira pacifica]
MKTINDLLQRFLEGDEIFVLPSEIAAESWARTIARQSIAVNRRRLISWDSFKELTFFGQQSWRPANGITRSVFARLILEQNRQEQLFSRIVPVKYRNDVGLYAQGISRMLPALGSLCRMPRERLEKVLGRALAADIFRLETAYRNFLEHHQRYEPSWQETSYVSDGRSYLILFPGLLEDFEDYKSQLESASGIRFQFLGEMEGNQQLNRYEDHRQELFRVMENVGELLQTGVNAWEIGVSVAGFDELKTRLSYTANSMGIPLSFRKGRPLIEYPSVAWLAQVAALRSDNYSFHALRRLLKNPGLPWKPGAEAAIKALLGEAVDTGLVEGGLRAWKRLAGSIDGNFRNYGLTSRPGIQSLFSYFDNMLDAPNGTELFDRIYEFFRAWLNTESWGAGDAAAWQRCAEEIKSLEKSLGEYPEFTPDMFEFLSAELASRLYLPQEQGGGIQVYDYRVASGAAFPYHFVLNLNAADSRVQKSGLGFLREDQYRELFGENGDMTRAFLKGYECSASRVFMSCSSMLKGRAVLPAENFLTERHGNAPWASPEYLLPGEPEQMGPFPGVSTGCEIPEDFEGSRWSQQLGIPGERISMSRVQSYIDCPQGMFWRLQNMEPCRTIPDVYPASSIGNAFHRIMEDLYRIIRDGDGSSPPQSFLSSRLEQYRGLADTLVKRMFGVDRSKPGSPQRNIPRSLHEQLKQRFIRAAQHILDQDAVLFDSWEIFGLEMELETTLNFRGENIRFHGRADRVMRNPADGTVAVLDYKSSSVPPFSRVLNGIQQHLPTVKEQKGMDPEDVIRLIQDCSSEPLSIQLPAYAYLLASMGYEVSRMGYYILKPGDNGLSGNYTSVLDIQDPPPATVSSQAPMKHPVLLNAVRQGAETQTIAALEGMAQGDFRMPDETCSSCSFKGLCRHRFAVKMPHEVKPRNEA